MKPLSLSKPHLIIMVGIPGAGKSFFAEHFAVTFNAPYVSYGRIRSELFNEPTYSDDENAIIARLSDYLLEELFKTGQTIIYEGLTEARVDRQEIAKKARDSGYEPLFVWVQTESITSKARAIKTTRDKQPARLAYFEAGLKRFTAPNELEKAVVISGKHTYASQLKIVLSRLVGSKPSVAPSSPIVTRSNIGGRHVIIR